MFKSRHFRLNAFLLTSIIFLGLSFTPEAGAQAPQRTITRFGDFTLYMALVNDNIWAFELSAAPVDEAKPFEMSIMLAPETKLHRPSGGGGAWNSAGSSVTVSQNPPTLTISAGAVPTFTFTPYAPDGQLAGLNFSGQYSHLMGLGADFRLSSDVFNLLGETILPGSPFGNARLTRFGYRPNQVQIPILYGLGADKNSCALFVDETMPLMWSFKGQPWTVSSAGPLGPDQSFRFFVITGPDLPSIRREFMSLIGRPPVPPQKAMGVWATGLAEANETDWRGKVNLLKNTVPGLTGLVASADDDVKFLSETAKAYNLRLMVDESAYVSQDSPLFTEMARRSFLVRQGGPDGQPIVVGHNGRLSGLVDYTNPAAPTYWHSLSRESQMNAGLNSFRLTDGDLDDFSSTAWYEGPPTYRTHSHYAWANIFSLKWLEGLEAGYRTQRLRNRPRLLMLSRTGTAGLARLGGTLYNGEPFLFNSRSQLAIKAHVALSGIDYYSSDMTHSLTSMPINQFGQSYDAFLAKSALTELPLLLPEDILTRPTARYNLALRETLGPYLYSLAWEAYQSGLPIVSPLAFYYQEDLNARNRVGEMMLGPSLLLGLDLDSNAERTGVYVPQGQWYNWRTGELVNQPESGLIQMDMKDAGQVTPPILAKSGAIIPAMEEMILKNGTVVKIPALKIFIGTESSEFTWYEDDGETQNYQGGRFGKTAITAVTGRDGSTVVTIRAREGTWDGAPSDRQILFDIYGPKAPGEATLDNLPYNRVAKAEDLDQLDAGWASFGNNRIRFKTPPLEMDRDHVLWFK